METSYQYSYGLPLPSFWACYHRWTAHLTARASHLMEGAHTTLFLGTLFQLRQWASSMLAAYYFPTHNHLTSDKTPTLFNTEVCKASIFQEIHCHKLWYSNMPVVYRLKLELSITSSRKHHGAFFTFFGKHETTERKRSPERCRSSNISQFLVTPLALNGGYYAVFNGEYSSNSLVAIHCSE